ncbi:serine hydrolase domain-containing protein [Microbacterium sp. PRC9]|uniref:serine hydrolase domain-containing protein n=1 Tax=Microbacterium sp. PRC9 TaxID=2962591 RepID=UPI0028818526|nr:serine hydrolase domain-containing protein [Microbacterium sp. PRC9]MDT0143333.1 serine hydrolase domain-containing protein [Microbacterium sp. PRC9]
MKALDTAHLSGSADERLEEVVTRLDGLLGADPDLSFQVAAFHEGRPVLDAWGGPHLAEDSVIVPYSVTKNTIGLSVGLLVERGELDLDERVATYWPEFAAKGKQHVTVRQLLSHQAGLPQADPALSWDELLHHHAAAERLAASRPYWHPGSAFGYHAITIGNLGDELVFRVTGRTLHEFYEQEIRAPHGIDFFLGLPPEHEGRRVDVLPMIKPVSDTSAPTFSALGPVVFGSMGGDVDLGNSRRSWEYGHPAGSGTGTARGIARLFAAAVTGVDGAEPFLSADTVAEIGQQQIRGYDEVLHQQDRAHAIVFQKPSQQLAFGGPRAFGHDGAAGALACVDPDTGLAFAWTIARGPWPGGADPRAVALARELGIRLSS